MQFQNKSVGISQAAGEKNQPDTGFGSTGRDCFIS